MGKQRAINAVKRLLCELQIDLSPPIDVRGAARALGIEIVERPGFELRGHGTVLGLLLRREGRTICVINRDQNPHRKRFSIAHEIGHYVLHPPQEAYIDPDFSVAARDDRSAEGTDPKEIEANTFAAEFLMPEEVVRAEVEGPLELFDDDQVKGLAKRFEVSVQAMTFRLTNLGLLS